MFCIDIPHYFMKPLKVCESSQCTFFRCYKDISKRAPRLDLALPCCREKYLQSILLSFCQSHIFGYTTTRLLQFCWLKLQEELKKTALFSVKNTRISVCRFIIFWNILTLIPPNRWRCGSWRKCVIWVIRILQGFFVKITAVPARSISNIFGWIKRRIYS